MKNCSFMSINNPFLMKKKDIPLPVLKTLNELKSLSDLAIVEFSVGDKKLFHLKDKDEHSKFYYTIVQYVSDSNKGYLLELVYYPISSEQLAPFTGKSLLTDAKKHLINWLEVIKEFNAEKFYNEDAIIAGYEEEFFEEYKIETERADSHSFNLEQQYFLETYLDNALKILDKYETSENKEEIKEVKLLVADLKQKQTKITIKEVIKKLSTIWAKSRKIGLPIIRELLLEIMKEGTKKLLFGPDTIL